MRPALLVLAAVSLSACDRTAPQGDEPPGLDPGSFEGSVRQADGPGFEILDGTARFATAGDGTVVVRVASPVAPPPDTTTLDLLIDPSATDLGAAGSALCYRSPLFADGPYRDEAGTVDVTRSDAATVEGTVDATAVAELQTGPTTTRRLRVRVEGAFRAVPAATGVAAADVRRCLPE